MSLPGRILVNGLRSVLAEVMEAAHGFRLGRHQLPSWAWFMAMAHGRLGGWDGPKKELVERENYENLTVCSAQHKLGVNGFKAY